MDTPSDIVFTPTVKALQQARGSRHAYARMEAGGGWQTAITDDVSKIDLFCRADSALSCRHT